jgi:hypothetical protein
MAPFSVSQGSSTVEISSTVSGFTQNSPYRYYFGNASATSSDSVTITLGDGAGVRLTDFNEITSSSSSSGNVIGIPSTPQAGFENSFNIIGGLGFAATFDVYDANSNLLLLNDYRPQNTSYIRPYARFGYTNGRLTIDAPRQGGVFGSASINTNGNGQFSPNPSFYVGGDAGTSVNQYVSGGGATPWVFSLTVPAPPPVVCFCKGTLIKTAEGKEVPIQELRIGDHIATSKGPLPIKWIAKRTAWKQRSTESEYEEALPVKIQAGSLGDGIPSQDLLVSRCHGMWIDGRVVNAKFLENGVNIYQVSEAEFPECVQYLHLEFDEEVLVEANSALACSYVNLNNRRHFDNYPEFISRYRCADLTASSVIKSGPRNRPSLKGHKDRTRRGWMSSGCPSDSYVQN